MDIHQEVGMMFAIATLVLESEFFMLNTHLLEHLIKFNCK